MSVNNDCYHEFGEDWYRATDHPVALLRQESLLKNWWIQQRLDHRDLQILDVGCGAGFIANQLQKRLNVQVTGVDLSKESLEIAKKYDDTKLVQYVHADAYHLPFLENSFDVITCLDFLEHVDKPALVIAEIARCLKPGGKFFYHTFNRNRFSHLIAIKGVEWFVKNTPEKLHVIDLFIKPQELRQWMSEVGLFEKEITGIAPKVFSRAFLRLLWSKEVSADFRFQTTAFKAISYMGFAVKK